MLAVSAAPTPLAPRLHQVAALGAIAHAEQRGVRRQLVSAPTGTGKTIVFAHLICARQVPTLVLVHRDELVRQAVDKLQAVAGEVSLDIGVVKAERDEHTKPVVIASVQTLARRSRLERVAPRFGLLVVDEAHHAEIDNSYGRILDYFGAFNDDGPLVVGYTATPFRPNGTPLTATPERPACFDEIVHSLTLAEAWRDGLLAPLRLATIYIKGLATELKQVKRSQGDYQADALERVLMAANTPEFLARGYQDTAMGRRALVFCPTVHMSLAVVETFRAAGLQAAAVLGDTPIAERQSLYGALREGRLHALVTCAVLTEGFDEPSVDCIILGRPTLSKVLFFQSIGRGLRLAPGKRDCLVIDAVGAAARHGLLSLAPQLGTLPREPTLMDTDVSRAEEEEEDANRDGQENLKGYDAQEVDLTRRTALHWVDIPRLGCSVISLKDRMIRVRPDGMGTYALEVRHERSTQYTCYVSRVSREMCLAMVADTARDMQVLSLVKRDAPWREQPASEKQRKFAASLGLLVDGAWTAGQVSDVIQVEQGQWYWRPLLQQLVADGTTTC